MEKHREAAQTTAAPVASQPNSSSNATSNSSNLNMTNASNASAINYSAMNLTRDQEVISDFLNQTRTYLNKITNGTNISLDDIRR